MTSSSLTTAHYTMLAQESGIIDEVIAERGYRSIDGASGYTELKALGFSKPQATPSTGLLLPLHTTDGQQPLMIYRPDQPQPDSNGRLKKYLLPKGAGVRLDCPPRCQPSLADPTIPLWLTEGQKKADALASHGAVALCLLGVWNFKGKNAVGGITLLADWDYVALNGREVRLVFDSDVVTLLSVRKALERLTEHLSRKGAAVRMVYLPAVAGKKVGVDDYLVAGHTLQDLEALIEAPRLQPQPAPPQIRILDNAPASLRRPLALIENRTYAAIWVYVEVTRTEILDKQGNIVRLPQPEATTEQQLCIARDDGVVFGEGGHKPLAVDHCGLLLAAAWTKNRQPGFQPLPGDLLERLYAFSSSGEPERLYMTGKTRMTTPVNALLYVPHNVARMLADDLRRAGIPRLTTKGKVDFHALRTTYINQVIANGATVPEAQALARHRTAALTIGIYGRSEDRRLQHLVAAVAASILPEAERASGVHAQVVGAEYIQEYQGDRAGSSPPDRRTPLHIVPRTYTAPIPQLTESLPHAIRGELSNSAAIPHAPQDLTHEGCAPDVHADLHAVITAWPTLSAERRAAILQLIQGEEVRG
jgi:hypothetical protein